MENNKLFICNENLDYFKILKELTSLKYFSNWIIFAYLGICLLELFIKDINTNNSINIIKCPVYSLLITNAITGTYLILFDWDKQIQKIIKNYCDKGFNKTKELQFNKQIEKYKNKIIIIRLFAIIVHWIPVFICSPLKVNSPNNMFCWLTSMFILIIYLLVMRNYYGKLDITTYILLYMISLFIINIYLFK